MSKILIFSFHTFPLILAWMYLLVAIFCVALHLRRLKCDTKISLWQWLFLGMNVGYVLFFFVMRLFFFDHWKQSFSVLGLLSVFISFIWSRYEDRCAGRRWWNW